MALPALIAAAAAVAVPILIKTAAIAAKTVAIVAKGATKTAVTATKAVAKGVGTVARTTGRVAAKAMRTVGKATARTITRVTRTAGKGAKTLAQQSIEANQQNIEPKPIATRFSQAKATGAKMAQRVLGAAEASARIVAATRPSRILAPPAVARRHQAARESTVRSSPAVQRVPARAIANAAPAVQRSAVKSLPRGQAVATTTAIPAPGGRRARPGPAQQPAQGPTVGMG